MYEPGRAMAEGEKSPCIKFLEKLYLSCGVFLVFILCLFSFYLYGFFFAVQTCLFYLLTNATSSRFWRTSLMPPWLLNRSFMSSRPRGSRKCGQITHVYFADVFATARQWWKLLLNIFRITKVIAIMWLGCTLLLNKSPKLIYYYSIWPFCTIIEAAVHLLYNWLFLVYCLAYGYHDLLLT